MKLHNCMTKPPKAPISYQTTAVFQESYSYNISYSPTGPNFPFGWQFLANSHPSQS